MRYPRLLRALALAIIVMMAAMSGIGSRSIWGFGPLEAFACASTAEIRITNQNPNPGFAGQVTELSGQWGCYQNTNGSDQPILRLYFGDGQDTGDVPANPRQAMGNFTFCHVYACKGTYTAYATLRSTGSSGKARSPNFTVTILPPAGGDCITAPVRHTSSVQSARAGHFRPE